MRRFFPPDPFSVLSSYRYRILESFLLALVFAFVFYKTGAGMDGILVRMLSDIPYDRTRAYLDERAHALVALNDTIANDPALKQSLQSHDQDAVLKYAVRIKNQKDIDFLTVIDKDGFVLSRTRMANFKGDNIFLNSVEGYELSRGNPILSYGANLLNPQEARLAAGKLITQDGIRLGAVMSGYIFDDAFARDVASHFLNPQTRLVFYTKDAGIVSSSFPEGVTRDLSTLLNRGSQWVASGKDSGTILYKGSYYYVRNIPLPFFDGTQKVGALVLFPLYVNAQFALFVVLTIWLLCRMWWPIIHKRKLSLQKAHILAIVAVSMVTFFVAAFGVVFYGRIFLQEKDSIIPELNIYNSTMRLSPDSGVFDQSFEQRISVVVDSGGEDINSVGAKLTYDPEKLKVVDIDTSASDCDEYLEKSADPATGKIQLICVLKSGNDRPKSFNVGTLVVQPLGGGETTLHIDDNSQVLANDGFATNVLRNTTDASYTLVNDTAFIWNSALAKDKRLIVHSLSHPNEERWYSNNKVSFVWSSVTDALFSYTLKDTETNTVVQSGTSTQNSITLTVPGSSQYEMEVTASSPQSDVLATGTTSVRVDTTPPDQVEVVVSHYSIKVGEVVRMILRGDDPESGLSSNYYVSIDGNTLLPVGGLVFIPFTSSGTKEITVRIFDKAGNYVDRTKYIRVGK